ncbi:MULTISPECIES: flagellar basal body-associated protein FliL [Rubrivivax]|uniref:Flagellar protein FliL n=1 Tax=Rubrivivax benzoatilyticus TaxID=316997 RepID=A0ABX0I1B4_9BURK|nr:MULTISPECIES: flagellar basal body-associated FliL family protein [Rubrivivax]MCD0418422.1 flagellar basal body-associated FliL family protein [Rubrivivax sp. JA1024]EGJ08799.1 flagellar basal body-associated protein FliL [Rubrivivax benzoatilyticus JA2 = ATCC BAA-35]MCC9596172.1 flagellar basal body-associated FliL family protein [Rubrivivax sp. JA1055]MCC9647487.1 flagellar basal body-associated FliL family protein [Rubrivivax sp. JA1029]NHK99927.1 flagellar basal body rod protein [Rubriv
MATAAPAAAAATDAVAPKKGKKKLLIIVGALVAVLAIGGGAAVFLLKKPHADTEEGAEDAEPAKAEVKHDPKSAPTFVPLDPFTVNLADRDAERYAQVGITLEVRDAKMGDTIKAYMPAIRNNILMALADKTAADLSDREGKAKLAEQVRRETARAMGYEVEEPDDEAAAEDKPKKKKKKTEELPISAVHFSNFIIQ